MSSLTSSSVVDQAGPDPRRLLAPRQAPPHPVRTARRVKALGRRSDATYSGRMRRLTPALIALTTALFSLAACGDEDADQVVDTATDTTSADIAAADTAAPPSPLYLRKADVAEDLVTGAVDFAQVGGAWLLGNDRARFTIQDVGVGAVYHLYGGSLIGADVIRPDGVAGANALRELFPVVDFRVLAPDRAVVVDDGAAGERAILRFEGQLAASRIVGVLDAVAGDAAFDVAVEYEVRPGEPYLRLRTIITNPTDNVHTITSGDFMIASKRLQPFAPGLGFITSDTVGSVRYLAFAGEEVSYAYVYPATGEVMVPAVFNAGTVSLLDTQLRLTPGDSVTIERLVVVGDGHLATVAEQAEVALAGEIGRVSGVVRTDAGEALAGVKVTALVVPDGGGEAAHAANQAVTDAAGVYAMTLPVGAYQLVAHGDHRAPSAPADARVAADGNVALDLTVARPAVVSVAVTGDGPRPDDDGTFPVRVAYRPLDADLYDGRLGDTADEDRWGGGWRVRHLGAGLDTFTVAPGRYEVVLSHGPEYEPVRLPDVTLADGAELTGHLVRAVEAAGWMGCDFHQHTIGSLDAKTTFEARVRENLGLGVECFATSEHDNTKDLGPVIAALGASSALYSLVGDEISVNGTGHFNSYPLPIDPDDPLALVGVQLWAGMTIPELFARLRALEGERVIQVNHPRSGSFDGYFSHLGLDPWDLATERDALPDDWDAVEVNADLGHSSDFTPEGWAALRERGPSDVPVMADWFGLLNDGRAVCGVANADCHDPGDDCGNPRTYLRIGDDPAALDDDAVVAAVKAQHAVGSRGIFLTVTADGEARMGMTELVDGAGAVELRIVAEAPSFVTVDRVEVYANGVFLEERAATAPTGDAIVWVDETLSVDRTEDTWFVVVARGGGATSPMFSGTPFAFTNPVYVDFDGDGVFTPPGPVPLPGQ